MTIVRANRPYVPAISERKRRYAADAEFREKAKSLARRSYRRKTNMELNTCLHSLDFLSEKAKTEEVRLPSGEVREMPVFYLSDTADVLQKLYHTVWRWTHSGMIPSPVLLANFSTAKPNSVYHIDEVRALVEEIGKHEKSIAYFRKDHTDVIERIEQRFNDIRSQLGYN